MIGRATTVCAPASALVSTLRPYHGAMKRTHKTKPGTPAPQAEASSDLATKLANAERQIEHMQVALEQARRALQTAQQVDAVVERARKPLIRLAVAAAIFAVAAVATRAIVKREDHDH